MKVNHVDNTRFGMKFTPNEGLAEMLRYSRDEIKRKTVRLSRRLARKYKGQEVSIENFKVDKGLNYTFSFDLKNLSSGTIYHNLQYAGINSSYYGWSKSRFDINRFLRDCRKLRGLFYLGPADKLEHNLTGTKKLLKNLLKLNQ